MMIRSLTQNAQAFVDGMSLAAVVFICTSCVNEVIVDIPEPQGSIPDPASAPGDDGKPAVDSRRRTTTTTIRRRRRRRRPSSAMTRARAP
jgi:hypothetical protein